jgi:hypothetical protein
MARTDEEVAKKLREIYKENFGGKAKQRYLISWADIREIYGFEKLFNSRYSLLEEAAIKCGVYLWDLGESKNGHFIAVIAIKTVDRWRRVPKRTIDNYRIEVEQDGDDLEDE